MRFECWVGTSYLKIWNENISIKYINPSIWLIWVSKVALCCVHRSVMSDSLWPHGLFVACQAPLSMGILQAIILEWVTLPSCTASSQPRDWTQVSWITGKFFTLLSHQGSPRILGWVAFPFSRGPSQLISLHRYVDVGLVISTLLVISLLNFLRCMYKKTGSRELGRILSKNKTNFSGNLPLLSLTSH